jgi:penicillin-binding protein 1C
MNWKKFHVKSLARKLIISISILVLLFVLLNLIFPLPDQVEYSVIITDDRGEVIHAFLTKDQQWRMKTDLSEISPLLKKTIIEKEDKYFYRHPGFNLLSIARAAFSNLIHMKRTSGASTITMQVARALEPRKRNLFSKSVEVFRAVQLEMKYSKDEILQLYLNLVPYGGNIQGVKAASLLYFNKNPDHLSLAEITALSIIPNRPSSLVLGKNNDKIIQQRNHWLRKFAADHVFSLKEIQDALEEPLTAKRRAVPALLPQLSLKLKRQGGTTIRTLIHLNMQGKLEKLVTDYVRDVKLKNIHQAAVVVIDNKTHAVVSYIGSADFHDTTDGGEVNGAAAVREPGSTLKPLLYGLCMDNGLLTPKMMITDVAVNYQGYAPENYDRRWNGFVTMSYALEHSLNIPAVKSLHALGEDKMIRALVSCDFKQIRKDHQKLGLSMILGGCGASLEELTGLFSCFANEGIYVKPLYGGKDTIQKKTRILSEASSFIITDILSQINRPDFPLQWESTEHLPKIAWKTGTSYGKRDAWSIGYNQQYTIGIWVGNFSGVGNPELSGANVATPLLFKIFNTIDYDNNGDWFHQPASCESRIVCSETGLSPGPYCKDLVSDYFIPLVSPSALCSNWSEVIVSPDEKISYCRVCMPANGYKKKMYKVIPPEMEDYYEIHKIAYQKIPVHNPLCEKVFREGGPSIVSPLNGNEYLISKEHPEPLMLSCHTSTDVNKVYWYINDQLYKSCQARTRQFFIPEEGPVKISCSDDKGRNRNSWIKVRYVDW